MRQDQLTLDQMLADPIVRRLMERDGVEEIQVRRLMDRMRRAVHGVDPAPCTPPSDDRRAA